MEDFTADSGTARETRRVTIRTYRHGHGDSHLVTLHADGGKTWRILIDGGVAPATHNAGPAMEQVMGDVLEETGGHVDLLVAMQQQADGRAFAKLDVGEAWMAWTEDPDDPAAIALRQERERALDKLRVAGAEVQLRGTDAEARVINALLGFYGVAGRAPSADPLAAVRAKTPAPVYCRPGDAARELPGMGARIHVLGPPHSDVGLSAKRGSESYNLALDEFVHNVMPNLDRTPVDNPFSTLYSIPEPVARAMPFFEEHYWEDAPWRRIDTAWITDATQYALVLDRLTNDASLGLAIELDGGDVLLFAPAGQAGNWSTSGRVADGRDLLARTVFYKVGRHGSLHAGAGNGGPGLLPRLRVAVIPVDQGAALPMRGGDLPLDALQRALAEAAGDRGYVLRTDQDAPAVAIDRGVTATAGYFDVPL